MQRHEVGGRVELVGRVRAVDAELAEALLGDEGVVGDDAHLEAERAPCNLLPDPPEAEDAERLARELDPAEARAFPAALRQGRVRLRDVPREREQEADRVLGGGDDRRLGRVRDDDAPACGGLDVHVVDADARATDHLQLVCTVDQLLRELGRRANDDAVVAPDDPLELGVAVDVDLEVCPEQLDACVRDRLANQDLHTRTGCSYASSARVTATPRSTSAPSSPRANSRAARAVVISKTS